MYIKLMIAAHPVRVLLIILIAVKSSESIQEKPRTKRAIVTAGIALGCSTVSGKLSELTEIYKPGNIAAIESLIQGDVFSIVGTMKKKGEEAGKKPFENAADTVKNAGKEAIDTIQKTAEEALDELKSASKKKNEAGTNSRTEDCEAKPAGNNISEHACSDIENESRELHDRFVCKVCMECQIQVTFVPCGHLVCCGQCALVLDECPICRTGISGMVRTYY
ncbi:E3 ubiquitin-protein ligase MYLIP-like [Gigantopelta aegis]|uniref:E3 ubiquitin-protein ligase MYLIP-like n=1 Tax=Gigantopelta aegis TaxID=1735272 RepID=UPI001B888326|nr:E3 ubiquitin-protein ligase MYLIP-like [Gigantopelta aegis]